MRVLAGPESVMLKTIFTLRQQTLDIHRKRGTSIHFIN